MAMNLIVGQSGGPTAVINSSLAGVYETAKNLGVNKVYGMLYGIEGLLQEKMVDLDEMLGDIMSIELLKRTPSSYLGSCRCKLPTRRRDLRFGRLRRLRRHRSCGNRSVYLRLLFVERGFLRV